MNRFMHTSIRLNTDLGRAARFFSKPDQIVRWLCSDAETAPDGSALFLSGAIAPGDHWQWHIETIEREKCITVRCTDLLQLDSTTEFPLEIKLMKCTSLTEYCTEIHVLQHGFEDSEAGDTLRARYLAFWRMKLEALRALVNGKWMIEDKDLTLDLFK